MAKILVKLNQAADRATAASKLLPRMLGFYNDDHNLLFISEDANLYDFFSKQYMNTQANNAAGEIGVVWNGDATRVDDALNELRDDIASANLLTLNSRGPWESGETYNVNDIVEYNGSSYIVHTQIVNSLVSPNTDTGHFYLLVAASDGINNAIAINFGVPASGPISISAGSNQRKALALTTPPVPFDIADGFSIQTKTTTATSDGVEQVAVASEDGRYQVNVTVAGNVVGNLAGGTARLTVELVMRNGIDNSYVGAISRTVYVTQEMLDLSNGGNIDICSFSTVVDLNAGDGILLGVSLSTVSGTPNLSFITTPGATGSMSICAVSAGAGGTGDDGAVSHPANEVVYGAGGSDPDTSNNKIKAGVSRLLTDAGIAITENRSLHILGSDGAVVPFIESVCTDPVCSLPVAASVVVDTDTATDMPTKYAVFAFTGILGTTKNRLASLFQAGQGAIAFTGLVKRAMGIAWGVVGTGIAHALLEVGRVSGTGVGHSNLVVFRDGGQEPTEGAAAGWDENDMTIFVSSDQTDQGDVAVLRLSQLVHAKNISGINGTTVSYVEGGYMGQPQVLIDGGGGSADLKDAFFVDNETDYKAALIAASPSEKLIVCTKPITMSLIPAPVYEVYGINRVYGAPVTYPADLGFWDTYSRLYHYNDIVIPSGTIGFGSIVGVAKMYARNVSVTGGGTANVTTYFQYERVTSGVITNASTGVFRSMWDNTYEWFRNALFVNDEASLRAALASTIAPTKLIIATADITLTAAPGVVNIRQVNSVLCLEGCSITQVGSGPTWSGPGGGDSASVFFYGILKLTGATFTAGGNLTIKTRRLQVLVSNVACSFTNAALTYELLFGSYSISGTGVYNALWDATGSNWETNTIDGEANVFHEKVNHKTTLIGDEAEYDSNDTGKMVVIPNPTGLDDITITGSQSGEADGTYVFGGYDTVGGVQYPYWYCSAKGTYLTHSDAANAPWYCIYTSRVPTYYNAWYVNFADEEQPVGTFTGIMARAYYAPVATQSSVSSGRAIRGFGVSVFDTIKTVFGQIVSLIPLQRTQSEISAMPHIEGRIVYNSDDHNWELDGYSSGTHLPIGRRTWERCKNVDVSEMKVGAAVFAYAGTPDGNEVDVMLAKADAGATVDQFVGLVAEAAIPVNGLGEVVTYGKVRGLNTSSLAIGPVYVSAAVSGGLTSTKPTGSGIVKVVGICTKVDNTDGSVFVLRSGVGYLSDLADIGTASVTKGGLLVADGSKWNSVPVSSSGRTMQSGSSGMPAWTWGGWLPPVLSATTTTPPASPSDGDRYIVPSGASGYWSTLDVGTIVEWNGEAWVGMSDTTAPDFSETLIRVIDTGRQLTWHGSSWVEFEGCTFRATTASELQKALQYGGTSVNNTKHIFLQRGVGLPTTTGIVGTNLIHVGATLGFEEAITLSKASAAAWADVKIVGADVTLSAGAGFTVSLDGVNLYVSRVSAYTYTYTFSSIGGSATYLYYEKFVNASGSGALAGSLSQTAWISPFKPTEFEVASQTAGDIMYFNGTAWVRLAKPSSNTMVLGTSADRLTPTWKAPTAGSGGLLYQYRRDGSASANQELGANAAGTSAAPTRIHKAGTISEASWGVDGGAGTMNFQYSKNGGTWTTLSAISGGSQASGLITGLNISVAAGDIIRLRFTDWYNGGYGAIYVS